MTRAWGCSSWAWGRPPKNGHLSRDLKNEEETAVLRSREEHDKQEDEREQRPREGRSMACSRGGEEPTRLQSADPGGEKREMRVREAGRGRAVEPHAMRDGSANEDCYGKE